MTQTTTQQIGNDIIIYLEEARKYFIEHTDEITRRTRGGTHIAIVPGFGMIDYCVKGLESKEFLIGRLRARTLSDKPIFVGSQGEFYDGSTQPHQEVLPVVREKTNIYSLRHTKERETDLLEEDGR